jgi:hypothetical protein
MQPSEHRDVESQLLAYVRQLERNYYDWRATHLHLSCLKPHKISGSWRLLFLWGEDGYAYDIDLWQGHRGRGRR